MKDIMSKTKKNIDIAFSSCPNDTFVFHAMLNGLIDTRGLSFNVHIDDVESLNQTGKKWYISGHKAFICCMA